MKDFPIKSLDISILPSLRRRGRGKLPFIVVENEISVI